MAHYALLNENNIVVQVITGVDENELIEGKNPEQWYGDFHNMRCLRTSYNTRFNQHLNGGTPFRGNYAGIGYFYDETFDAFVGPSPFPSWKMDYSMFKWVAPIPRPDDEEGFRLAWSEPNKEWIKIAIPSA